MNVCTSNRKVIVPGRVHPVVQRSTMGSFFIRTEAVGSGIKKWDNVNFTNSECSDNDEPPRKKSAQGPGFVRACITNRKL